MLLPARMTRILLGGHVSRMEDAIEALHQAGVMHLEDFDGAGHTDIGTPLEAGDEASALLVRVRGLQKAIGAEGMPPRAMAPGHQEEVLAEAEDATRSVLDEAASVRTEMALRQSEIAQLEPFSDIHVDLSLVGGLDSVQAYFGTARDRPRLARPHELEAAPYGSGLAVALFVRTQHRVDAEKALQESGFTPATLPTGRSGTPSQRLLTLYAERKEMEARLQAAEARIEQLRHHWGPKLAALEGSLTEQVQKTQAPLRFGVTERTFHAEGWVPRRQAARLRSALSSKLGSSLYYEELGDGAGHATPSAGHASGHAAAGHAHGAGAATVSGQTVHGAGHGHDGDSHDGHGGDGHGHHSGPDDEPPVALENPKIARPYQFLLSLLGRPRYGEIDPTTLMLIFFPLFFGLMVGDVALGLLIVLVGLFLKNNKVFGIGGHAISRALIAGGIFSILAGAFIFGEALGMHFVLDEHSLEEGEYSWEAVIYGLDAVKHGEAGFDSEGLLRKTGGHVDELGHDATATGTDSEALHGSAFTIHQEHVEVEEHAPAMFSPESFKPHSDVHLQMGPVPLGLYSKTHDAQALLQWAAIIGFFHIVLGLLLGIRNVAKNHGVVLAVQEKASWLLLIAAVGLSVYGLGDGGRTVLALGLALAAVSIVLLWIGVAKTIGQGNMGMGFIALLEIPALVSNILSYTRLAAIGASKAGMAIAFASIAFETVGGGDIHSILGWTLYLVSSLLILVLAIIAGTLQSLRLQFVEFFGKFYEGGGRPYVPFGRRAAQG